MDKTEEYGAKIRQEAEYWAQFEEEANKFGIPCWCDLRRATKLTKIIGSWIHDPKTEEILRGGCKIRLIGAASKVKGRALDIGCGAGWLSLELARRGMCVDGMEISVGRLRLAERYLAENPFRDGFGGVNYSVQDINTAEFGQGVYRSVVAWDTLHHVSELDSVVKRVHAALQPGGCFAVYDHIGLKKMNRWWIRAFKAPILPLLLFFRARNRHKARAGAESPAPTAAREKALISPFEDVSGREMIGVIGKYFTVETMITELSFAAALAGELLVLPDALKYFFLRLLKAADELLIKTGLASGEYVFIVARKKHQPVEQNLKGGR